MTYTVAVRALCEFTARSGDLDLRFTPAPTALEGMAGHRTVRARRSTRYEAEISCAGGYEDLRVRGRADGFDPETQQLEEIKTYRGRLDSVRANHRALHWAQAKVYGHLLCQERGLAQVRVALVYFNVGTHEETTLVETCTAASLLQFFESQCNRFLTWARNEDVHRARRDAALLDLQFPLPQFRAGQRDLAVAVYRCATSQAEPRVLMAQAPTGIGKTVGTLFPLLKVVPSQGLDKLFFLTAKGTGHSVALEALSSINRSLQGQDAAFQLRVLDMQARDKTCEHPGSACHGDSCPLARGFFDRLAAARDAAVLHAQPWSPSAVRHIALAHGVCPYYLAQELVRWSDVVVADYNYYYDATAMLFALTQAQQWKTAVLVDEAHNLVDRARQMYTAELTLVLLTTARKASEGLVKKALDRVHRQWSALTKAQESTYLAHGEVPPALLSALHRAVGAMAETQGDGPMPPDHPLLGFYFEALRFCALADGLGTHALFDVTINGRELKGRGRENSSLCIRNVVPAPYLAVRHASAHAVVLFSGTLSPVGFYRDILGLPHESGSISVDAPFHSSQLSVTVASRISTRYADRAASVSPISNLIAQQFARQPGNYLCFFSSFDYLQQVADATEHNHPSVPVWRQMPSMNDEARHAFLARFTEDGQGVGFAVLGGAFAEGIDLPGQRLIGAFVATLGLPQVNPINEQMKQAMDRHFGADKGYDYTYLYPGLRKVVQAAGRVIRTEQDTGVVFLIDDRYRRTQVQSLLPRWWDLGTR